jgi:uncharacterized membrane protein
MSVAAPAFPKTRKRSRLGYIDWLRGVAIILMIQAHAIDSWLLPDARGGRFYRWSQFLAGAPAPLFLFLAGLSLVLVTTRMADRGATQAAIVRDAARRGLQVIGYALAFRVLVFATSGFTDARNLLRADVLNCIGLSMLACAILVVPLRSWAGRLTAAVLVTLAFCLLTPLAWDSLPASLLPMPLYVYISGRPPLAFFPLFPWAAYCSAGVAAGLIVVRGMAQKREGRALSLLTAVGAALLALGMALDRLPSVYPQDDFWHTSPSFFWMRTGVVLLLMGLAYAWHLLPFSHWPSALRQMGRTSLLIYWVHVEIAYGGIFTRWAHRKLMPSEALLGTAILTVAMLGLSLARTNAPSFWANRTRAKSAGTAARCRPTAG